MTKLKCPFCKKPFRHETLKIGIQVIDLYLCSNPECEPSECLVGTREFWDILGQLIRTRKALEIIKKEIHKETMPDFVVIRDALKTAEQKDIK